MDLLPIPARTPQTHCSSCGQGIWFAPHPSTGRPHPISTNHEDAEEPTPFADGRGISHFSDCPSADQHRAPRTHEGARTMSPETAELLPLLGATASWDGWGTTRLGLVPDKVLRVARRWFSEKLKTSDDERMTRQIAAITLILEHREANSPQGSLAL